MSKGHIAFDLDATLAQYSPGDFPNIGKPIPEMISRVQDLLERGWEVRIFTARMSEQADTQLPLIEAWCLEHIGVKLPVTCVKHYDLAYFYDDRARQVEPNTGKVLEDEYRKLNIAYTELTVDFQTLKRKYRDLEFDKGALELAYTLVKKNLRELQDKDQSF